MDSGRTGGSRPPLPARWWALPPPPATRSGAVPPRSAGRGMNHPLHRRGCEPNHSRSTGRRGLTASLSRHGALLRRVPHACSRGQADPFRDRAAGAEAGLLRRWAAMSSLALRLQRGLGPAAYGGLRAAAPPCPALPGAPGACGRCPALPCPARGDRGARWPLSRCSSLLLPRLIPHPQPWEDRAAHGGHWVGSGEIDHSPQ